MTVVAKDINKIVRHYLHAALWTGELDREFDIENIHPDSINAAVADCKTFVEKAGELLNDLDEDTIGHNFWLTRNGHGANFRDLDDRELGKKLADIARNKDFPERNTFAPDADCDTIIIE